MKIYLAASYDRMGEMRIIRGMLNKIGHEVTSRWIDGHPEINNGDSIDTKMLNEPAWLETCREIAIADLEDIDKADALISFHGSSTTQARHVEFGYAYAAGKKILVVGDRENLFHALPGVLVFERFADVLTYMSILELEKSYGL